MDRHSRTVPRHGLHELRHHIHHIQTQTAAALDELEQFRLLGDGRNERRSNRTFERLHRRLGDLQESIGQLSKLKPKAPHPYRLNNVPTAETVRVLWVENDLDHVRYFRRIFEDSGWALTHAKNVRGALSHCDAEDFDGMLIDLFMPRGVLPKEEIANDLTGLALARRVRRRYPTLPIVFLSFADNQEVVDWCRRSPPATLLVKSELSEGEVRRADALIRYGEDVSTEDIESLLRALPTFVASLNQRGADPPRFLLKTEYDVQDLVRALLCLACDDVRPEEVSPSYAGGSSRIDFVLPGRGIAVEVKMTRGTMTPRDLGNALLEDIPRYTRHPDVQALICYIVDAARVLTNETGFAKDICEKFSSRLTVRVVIVRL